PRRQFAHKFRVNPLNSLELARPVAIRRRRPPQPRRPVRLPLRRQPPFRAIGHLFLQSHSSSSRCRSRSRSPIPFGAGNTHRIGLRLRLVQSRYLFPISPNASTRRSLKKGHVLLVASIRAGSISTISVASASAGASAITWPNGSQTNDPPQNSI